MAQHYENKTIDDVLELLTTNGFINGVCKVERKKRLLDVSVMLFPGFILTAK